MVTDFMLLDSTYFFLTTVANYGEIRLYKLVRSSAAATKAIHLATLHLPPMSPGITFLTISSHAGPIEANPLSHLPFAIHDDDRLHMFTMVYTEVMSEDSPRRLHYLNMFLHQRVLLKYAHPLTEHAPLDIPWAEWGPPNTRWGHSSPPELVKYWTRLLLPLLENQNNCSAHISYLFCAQMHLRSACRFEARY
jgi:hypothetical protein